jgi:energy-converting hydrogenase A subunit M
MKMMMISILNIAMELMTNQLTTKKKKILTNYLYYIIIFL